MLLTPGLDCNYNVIPIVLEFAPGIQCNWFALFGGLILWTGFIGEQIAMLVLGLCGLLAFYPAASFATAQVGCYHSSSL
jgi:hypothetical protein